MGEEYAHELACTSEPEAPTLEFVGQAFGGARIDYARRRESRNGHMSRLLMII